jgi:hypothetical protein
MACANAACRTVVELMEAMALLAAGKFRKAVAFVYSQATVRVRTTNPVERANRRFRFTGKLRYKWQRRKWVLLCVLLALDRCWCAAAEAADQAGRAARAEQQQPPSPKGPLVEGGDQRGVSPGTDKINLRPWEVVIGQLDDQGLALLRLASKRDVISADPREYRCPFVGPICSWPSRS